MPLVSAKDVLPQLLKRREDNDHIYLEDGYLILDFCGKYEISTDRISTPEQVLGWVCHLSEKTWMTKERLYNFIDKCGMVNNTDYTQCG